MPDPVTAIAAAAAAAWVILIAFRHGFWRCDQRLPEVHAPLRVWPSVAVLVPARNEEETVERCLTALAEQDYSGALSIVLIDDSSTDRTAERARRTCTQRPGCHSIRVQKAMPLSAGWAGKLWALQNGLESLPSGTEAPDYVWFTDADVTHSPDTLTRLVSLVEDRKLAMASLMVKLSCKGFWERLLVPAFIFFFQMLYPFRAVNDPHSRIAGAAGGCVLLQRSALESAGGLAAVRDALIDDCALARLLKHNGYRIWLGLAENSHSLRQYVGLAEFWQMVTRSAFVQLDHSVVLLVGSTLGLFIAFLAAPLISLSYAVDENLWAAGIAGVTWVAMCLTYAPCLRYHQLGLLRGVMLPLCALLYLFMTLHSALRHWTGAGSSWKNRSYVPK